MNGFTLHTSDDGWLKVSVPNDPVSHFICQTTASAEEWAERLLAAGLVKRDDKGELHDARSGYTFGADLDAAIASLAGYWTNRDNPTDDFRDGIREHDLEHLPYAALAWIDHEIRKWAADHARSKVTWEGEVEGDIHKKAAEIILDTCERFDHENPACAMHEHGPQREAGVKGSCTPGETRLYAFGDYEESPIPLCRGCFHRQLERDGEAGRHARYFLREGFLTLDQWEEADKPASTPATAAQPSVTAATSAALVADFANRAPTREELKAHYEAP